MQSTSALAYQASKSSLKKCAFCLGQHWSHKSDVKTDIEARKSYLENHKNVLIVYECHLNNKYLKNYGKGIHNSAICNNKEEKEPLETTSNPSTTDKETILLQTAEMHVLNENNNKKSVTTQGVYVLNLLP